MMQENVFSIELDTAAGAVALSTADAKTHMRVTFNDDDTYIASLVKAATKQLQRDTGRALITQTWLGYLDAWLSTIWLPRPPAQSVTHLKYYDTSDVQQTLTVDEDYTVDLKSTPARIVPYYGNVWPTPRGKPAAIEIKWVCGYGDAATDIEEDLGHALKLLVSHYYENREPVTIEGVPRDVQKTYNALIYSFRVRWPRR